MRRIALVLIVLVAACSKKEDPASKPDPAKKDPGKVDPAKPDPAKPGPIKPDPVKPDPAKDPVAPTKQHAKITGPAVNPSVTSSITFVVPKDSTTWAEMAFPCYKAAIELQPGTKASQPFYQVSPLIEPALKAADINIDTDFAAIGGFECGGEPCIYIAANLRHPEKIGEMLKAIPGIAPKEVAKGHFQFEAPGASGKRMIHIRTVPIQWADPLPADAWSLDMAKATHILFLSGISGGKNDVDPLTLLADATAGADKVKTTEAVLGDSHGRCVVGTVGKNDFKPGFKIDHARFAMAAPPGHPDPITTLLGSTRTLDVELELTLAPAPKETDVTRWIGEARKWVNDTVSPIKAQFAGGGPMVDAYLEMMAVVGERGFSHKLGGPALTLSWQTSKVPQSDITALEKKFAGLVSP